MIKVSIIVPFYNTEEYLNECIKSITYQTYPNLEIILVDDCSTDNSKKIAEDFRKIDSRIKITYNQIRSGVGKSRNIGIKKANGDFIYFVDSDDYIHHNAIKRLVDVVEEKDNVISGSISTITNLNEIDKFTERVTELPVSYKLSSKNFKGRSALKALYRSNFIKNLNIKFSEDVNIYADHPFTYEVIKHSKEIKYVRNSRYFRRRRHDRVTNPSLKELSRYDKIIDFTRIYTSIAPKYHSDTFMKQLIDRDFLNFYRKVVVMFMKASTEEEFKEVFPRLHNSARYLINESYKNLNPLIKREIKALKYYETKKFLKYLRIHHELRDFKKIIGSKKNLYKWIYKKRFLKQPIDSHKVVFESFMGKNYSGNPKAIYESMKKEFKDKEYSYIWVYKENPLPISADDKQVKRFSLAYYKAMATAKYWIVNTRLPKHIEKRTDQLYLQTWHGTPLKHLGMDISNVQMPGTDTGRYKKNFTEEAARWDYLIAQNKYSSEIFKRAFMFNGKILEYGYPRNDILVQQSGNEVNSLKEKIGLPNDKKVILYAPTWRDNHYFEKGKYKFKLALDLEKMKSKLGNDYIIILRLHYVIAEQLDLSQHKGFVYDLSTYGDINDLYLISDLLITDYSSVFFDYANLKKPMLFYTYDLEDYRDSVRGLYFDFEKVVPGPLLRSTDEVISTIQNIESIQIKYREQYDNFYKKFNSLDDGRAAERVINEILKSQPEYDLISERTTEV
ncbi:bifunctional glycosyltransferase family 2 protein/CDP-glycerol:glycerophosphate glycerophosphotransferase [Allobacillus sp. SKP2-8]|uniref:bifunctional glycosyltransferase/CDP-glycerol:glycerophosphate glycerophosphotransferase n=1 Tax=unclassified Allobacillus TaxID=2628859 RepID=UPI00118219C5|nr:bifunctional glycosyltransferase family 2 protein/CDP-glycerol:glycerophosphate glycerophosphotransferase [Allobacillus sp. SKP2-8]TSJ65255.1 bifunctional glycosyltransferase family 2 protein/CDP-glycerol:glycerophosphate glycerophosphotransferase [Allobacillus sp. SKP2-8]